MDKVQALIKLYAKMTGEDGLKISTYGKDQKVLEDKRVKK